MLLLLPWGTNYLFVMLLLPTCVILNFFPCLNILRQTCMICSFVYVVRRGGGGNGCMQPCHPDYD